MNKFELKKGETLLWEGRPESFSLFDCCVTPSLLKDLLVSLIGGLLIVAEYWFCSGRGPLRPGIFWIPAMLVCVPLVRVFSDAFILNRSRYYATNRRLAIVNSVVKDVEYTRIPEAAFKTDRAGHTSLLCGGKAVLAGDSSFRERAVVGLDALIGEDTVCDSFAFYAVDDPDALNSALKNILSVSPVS